MTVVLVILAVGALGFCFLPGMWFFLTPLVWFLLALIGSMQT